MKWKLLRNTFVPFPIRVPYGKKGVQISYLPSISVRKMYVNACMIHIQEEECVENLFDALAASLLVPDNQARFRYGKSNKCITNSRMCHKTQTNVTMVIEFRRSIRRSCREPTTTFPPLVTAVSPLLRVILSNKCIYGCLIPCIVRPFLLSHIFPSLSIITGLEEDIPIPPRAFLEPSAQFNATASLFFIDILQHSTVKTAVCDFFFYCIALLCSSNNRLPYLLLY